jgi:hypothetical protein
VTDAAAAHTDAETTDRPPVRPTLTAAVRRRRADQAFFLRLAGTIAQNQQALDRLIR